MRAVSGAALCRVCKERAAAYTCPRCNARYCSVDCYQRHSERCTEGFYRESTVQELKSITVTADQKQRMLQILQQLHEAELGTGGSDSDDDDGAEAAGAAGAAGSPGPAGLSEATLHHLLTKLQACGGAELDVAESDLSPAELAEFRRAVAAGEVGGVVAPWEPWWLSQEAAALELSARGTALVASADAAGADLEGAAGSCAALLPAPPNKPLPPLSALTRSTPSPLLQYQLLDLLYSYCFTLRLHNGDYQSAALEAADLLFAISGALAAAAAPAGASGASSASGSGGGGARTGGPSSSSSGTSTSAASVLLECLSRACQPPAGSREQRGFAVAVLADVAALLQQGRPLVLTALMDLSRLLEAAREEVSLESPAGAGSSSGGGSGGQRPGDGKALAKKLLAAQRKLLFFMSWGNEQPPEAYALLRLAVVAEGEKLAASLGGAKASQGEVAGAPPQQQQGRGPAGITVMDQ